MNSGATLTAFNLQPYPYPLGSLKEYGECCTNNLQPSTYFSPLAPDLVVTLDFTQLRELLTAIAQTDIAELTLKSADFELTVRKGIPTTTSVAPALSSPGGDATAAFVSTAIQPVVMPTAPPPPMAIATGEAPTPPPSAAVPISDSKWIEVKSPMVGTFYRSPAPDEPPYVEAGDRIRIGQTICIIEAMKLMNEIEAEVSGQVMEILVQNGEPVEYDQPLMRINPG